MTTTSAAAIPALLTRSITFLEQGAALAAVLPIENYQANAPGTQSGSVGAHLRHCIEFYRSLLAAVDSGDLDYDLRPRDNELESDPMQAALALHDLVRKLPKLATKDLSAMIRVRHDYDDDGEAAWAASTLARELNFLLSHTVHHYALIAAQLRQAGVMLPEGFGVSPATQRYRQVCGMAALAAS